MLSEGAGMGKITFESENTKVNPQHISTATASEGRSLKSLAYFIPTISFSQCSPSSRQLLERWTILRVTIFVGYPLGHVMIRVHGVAHRHIP